MLIGDLGSLDQYVLHSPRKSLCSGILETFGCHQYNYVGNAHPPSVFLLEGRIDGACWQSHCFPYHYNGKKRVTGQEKMWGGRGDDTFGAEGHLGEKKNDVCRL